MPEGVPVEYPIEVVWEGDRRYRGGPAGGPTLVVDGNREVAPSPVDTLIIAMASCSAIDVVDYLEKRRTPASSLSVSVRFSRAPSPPRRVTDAHLTFRVATDSPRDHVERAVQLSFEKYCSVSNSLAADTRLEWSVEMEPAAAEAAAGKAAG
jgi:putative redox protein